MPIVLLKIRIKSEKCTYEIKGLNIPLLVNRAISSRGENHIF